MTCQQTDLLVLFFYREPFGPTVMEHINCFEAYSTFQVLPLNLADPDATERLRRIEARCILLHYTLFGMQYYQITEEQAWIVGEAPALKVAFFQDEYHRFPKRCQFIDEYDIDVVYTLVEPQYWRLTYYARCRAPVICHTLAGYVSDSLVARSRCMAATQVLRDIDVGYRGHELDISYGRAGQEKCVIGEDFKRRVATEGLRLDIETAVEKRIYGEDWYHFISRCRAMLGVEAGVSAFDLEDTIRQEVRALRRRLPDISDEEVWADAVAPWEDNVYYRTISPRHFEAAALGTLQILFEGTYTGLMQPWVHYIPLQNDFGNLEDVLKALQDSALLHHITAQARQELIDSGRFHYREFVAGVERHLRLLGLRPAGRTARKGGGHA